MEPIPGANTTQYTTQDVDAGYAILFRATGDGDNIEGLCALNSMQPILSPNKAFISNVTQWFRP